MKKIIFVNIKDKPKTLRQLQEQGGSGTISSMLFVAHGLAGNGYDVSIIYSNVGERDEDGIKYISLGNKDIKSILRKEMPDVLIVVGHSGDILLSERLLENDIIYWVHNWIDINKYKKAYAEKKIDKFVFVSDYHRCMTLVSFRFSRDVYNSCYTILNPLHLEKIKRKPDYSINESVKIAFVGYPSRHKGFFEVCKIVNDLNKKNINAILNVFGDSKLYHDKNDDLFSDELVKSLIDSNSIIMHGTLGRDDLYYSIAKNDIVISGMTGSETFCVSLAEAQAAAIPVLTLDRGGQISFVTNKSGYLVSGVNEAIESMRQFINISEKERRALGENGVINTQKLSLTTVTSDWDKLIKDLNTGYLFGKMKYFQDITKGLYWKLKEALM